ncbi:MAG: SDR family oxidoreductase [Gaiellaceae bacterium]
MKVFVTGASGAIGRQLVPMLIESGHDVVAMTRSPERASTLRAMGAEPVVADALDREAVWTPSPGRLPRRSCIRPRRCPGGSI